MPKKNSGGNGPSGNASNDRFFAEPKPSPDEVSFTRKVTDNRYYKLLETQLQPVPPAKRDPPYLALADIIGQEAVNKIAAAKRTLFHSVGDTGPTGGPKTIAQVADHMVADFRDPEPDCPAFFYHLGDVVYNFGEAEYYFEQFYEPYRDYAAPIFAIPGNHDGMVYRSEVAKSLDAFLANFCDDHPRHPPEAGGLVRTTMTQPGVYFSLEAPLVTVIGLYSNCGEHGGVISSEGGRYKNLDDRQLTFLTAALQHAEDKRKKEKGGAIVLATHHPPYSGDARHGGSSEMLKEIEGCCKKAGVTPHALLSGHAHFYQRFTAELNGKETPFLVAGSGGHRVTPPQQHSTDSIRTPLRDANGVTMEKYLPVFGYLRIVVEPATMMIEFYDCSENEISSKSPADRCSIDLDSHAIVHKPIPAAHQWNEPGARRRRPERG